MLLVSYSFAAFCLALFAVYYLFPGRFQWIVLLVFSCLFYVYGGVRGIAYPLVTTGSAWLLAGQIGRQTKEAGRYMKEQGFDRIQKKAYTKQVKKKQRRLMIVGLVLNFGILAAVKYTSFFMTLGISYYTFQAMGYLIDVYRRKYEPERNPAKLALFVVFFLQLTAGPIGRFDHMREELFREHHFSLAGFRLGAERVLWGYFKKLVIADRIGPAAAVITGSPELYGGFFAFVGMLFHVIELYADFSGCIDIVLGLSQMLGITLPENFERPFFSKNLSEFWRRWHMSLMQWFREYIFFPVSTSRLSQRFAKAVGRVWGRKAGSRAPVWLASLVVWFVTGIWHGASWRFVTWGLANCAVILASQELSGVYRAFHDRFAFSNRLQYRYFEILRTCLVFGLLQMLLYASVSDIFAMFLGMAAGEGLSELCSGGLLTLGLNGADYGIFLLGIFLVFFAEILGRGGSVRERLEGGPKWLCYLLFFSLFLLAITTGVYGHGYDASQFIYNQF